MVIQVNYLRNNYQKVQIVFTKPYNELKREKTSEIDSKPVKTNKNNPKPAKTSQNKPKQPQNAKAIQSKIQIDPKQAKTTQNEQK